MADLQNIFSWSKSRDEQFRECQRKYFYDKYLSWGGWDRKAPQENRLAYILKNIKNRWAWKGETVHHVIESALKILRASQPMPLETAIELLTKTMRQDYRDSKAKKYMEDPKKFRGLFEHEYEKSIADEIWKEVHDSSAECLKNFYQSKIFEELKTDNKKDWLMIEELEAFDFEGSKIYVKLDFARKKEDRVEIYDWKTGKEKNRKDPQDIAADVQLGTYALYAMQKWQLPLEKIRTYLFNLGSPHAVPENVPLSETLIDRTREAMRESIRSMQNLLEDPVKNVPKPREHFTFTENTRLCGFCNFYKICDKYQL